MSPLPDRDDENLIPQNEGDQKTNKNLLPPQDDVKDKPAADKPIEEASSRDSTDQDQDSQGPSDETKEAASSEIAEEKIEQLKESDSSPFNGKTGLGGPSAFQFKGIAFALFFLEIALIPLAIIGFVFVNKGPAFLPIGIVASVLFLTIGMGMAMAFLSPDKMKFMSSKGASIVAASLGILSLVGTISLAVIGNRGSNSQEQGSSESISSSPVISSSQSQAPSSNGEFSSASQGSSLISSSSSESLSASEEISSSQSSENSTEVSSSSSDNSAESSLISEESSSESSEEVTVKAAVTKAPSEYEDGKLVMDFKGGEWSGTYYATLLPYSDSRGYQISEWVEATYDEKEKRVYQIKPLETYGLILLADGAVCDSENEAVSKMPVEQLEMALEIVEEDIGKATFYGDYKEFSTEGFTVNYDVIPNINIGSDGEFGFGIDLGSWKGNYYIELPRMTDTRYYDDESIPETETTAESISYRMKNQDNIYENFKEDIRIGDKLNDGGAFDPSTRSEGEIEWLRRCFNQILGEYYAKYGLFEYSATGKPAYTDQLKYSIVGNSYAIVTGVSSEYASTLTEVVVPSRVTIKGSNLPVKEIARNAFFENDVIEKVTIGPNVTKISENAFGSCTYLEEVTFQTRTENYCTLSPNAFCGNANLKKVVVNDAVLRFGDFCFADCSNLLSFSSGANATSIGPHAFSGCAKLADVTLGNAMKDIEKAAFNECTSLESLDLGTSLKTIAFVAFQGCPLNTTVKLPASLTYFEAAFVDNENIVFDVDEDNPNFSLFHRYVLQKLEENTYRIVASDYNVGGDASFNNRFESGGVGNAFPIKSVAPYAFAKRNSLKLIDFGSTLETIEYNAFFNATALETIALEGTSLRRIESSAFAGCSSLTRLNSITAHPNSISTQLTGIAIHAFEGTKIAELDLSNEKKLALLQPQTFVGMSELVTITFPKTIQYIHGSLFLGDDKLGDGGVNAVIFPGTVDEWKAIGKNSEWAKGAPSSAKMYFAGDEATSLLKNVTW